MCLISPLFGLPRNQKERMRGAGQIVSVDVITLLLCKFYLCSVRCVSLLESSDLPFPPSIIHGRPFPECARLSFDQVLPTRVEPLLSVSGGRARGRWQCVLQATRSRTRHLSLSLSLTLSLISPSMQPTFTPSSKLLGCPSLPIANHNVIFTYILR